MTLSGGHFLGVEDCSRQEWHNLLQLAGALKRGEIQLSTPSTVKVLGLLFSKPSTRTRVSFAVAMARLGGQTLDLPPKSTQVGRGESIADTARV
ncbi:MAG: ornithine carbamoyltransferase, partial [Candidatus Synechococcus spongiarum 142]